MKNPNLQPPIAKVVPHELKKHGKVRQDPYYWLRDDSREDSEMLEYLQAEQDYAEATLDPYSEFRHQLFEEIVARIPQEDQTVPYKENGYYYYGRREKDREFSLHCRRRTLEEPEENHSRRQC